ncbi:MAG: CARDB domain-containing protein, partial [Gemmatimonadales bacterium]
MRCLAPARRRVLFTAICRIPVGAGAIALAGLALACQPGTEPTGDNQSGTIAVSVSGLPPGSLAAVTVSGPGGYQRTLTASETLADLSLGTYLVTAASVVVEGDGFGPSLSSQNVAITTANPAASVSVSYTATTGRLQITIAGVPPGASAAVELSGPGGYQRYLTVSELVPGLSPGEYTVTSSLITSGGYSYLAAPSTQAISITAGAMALADVTYFPATGSLGVTITGLPSGTPAQVTLTGPGGFSQLLSESQLVSGLAPGPYTLDAAPVTSGGVTYSPAPLSQSRTVYAGQNTTATVGYAPPGGSGDLRIDAVYLTQATQRLDGSVPLVAGRDGYLRAFALADGANALQPAVRVRLYQSGNLVQTYTIPAPGVSVPMAADESSLANSWNVLIPGPLVQPGLAVLADVDPGNGVAESDESNNQFPVSGSPASVDVRALPTFAIRLVPVLQQANGLQGNVTSANLETFLNDFRQMLPVGASDADLRDVYTTTAPALQGNNSNNAWNTVLAELLALRTADASTRYYYGVVKVNYASGTAGMGYVGGGARTAIGWDYLPSGSRVMAHELGHNMGRLHAPCGPVGGPDPNYPYSGGVIGAWGLNLNGLVLKPPTTADVLGYCQPVWVSDYNWRAMVAYREGGPNNA